LQHANNLRALLKGLAMTRFVHTDFPTTHAGIARVEAALGAARRASRQDGEPTHHGSEYRASRNLIGRNYG
jgi:hypothetical protein